MTILSALIGDLWPYIAGAVAVVAALAVIMVFVQGKTGSAKWETRPEAHR